MDFLGFFGVCGAFLCPFVEWFLFLPPLDFLANLMIPTPAMITMMKIENSASVSPPKPDLVSIVISVV